MPKGCYPISYNFFADLAYNRGKWDWTVVFSQLFRTFLKEKSLIYQTPLFCSIYQQKHGRGEGKSSKRGGGGEKREDQGGRGMTKVTKVVKMMTMKTKMLTLVKWRSTVPIQLNRKGLRNNNYLSIYGLPFFLISLLWHNSQVFFTFCLNHVNRHDVCMYFNEPEQ